MAAAVLSESASVGSLAALGAAHGLATAFEFPAMGALLAQTVPTTIRQQANALMRLGANGAAIAGAGIGGLVIAVSGPGWGLAADAASFAVAGALFALVQVGDHRVPNKGSESVWHQLRIGWRAFTAQNWVERSSPVAPCGTWP